MIGKELPVCKHSTAHASDQVKLKLAGLSHASDDPFGTDLKDIHLEVRAGEIFGIAGVSGNGQQELLMAISGEQLLAEKYPIQICGEQAGTLDPGARRTLGMCFVPEERLGRGAVPTMSLSDNTLLTAYRQGMLSHGLINFKKIEKFASACIKKFDVKCGGSPSVAQSLSGGNLQKFIMGREILQTPEVLVVSQPTWGVDVGAAAFIRQQIIDLRDSGAAILVISEEIEELFEITDRIAVIADGKVSPSKPTAESSIEEIGVWMSGMWPGAEPLAETLAEHQTEQPGAEQ